VDDLPAAQDSSRRIGRGVFLATVAGGLSSLYWGKAAWGHVSHALHGVDEVLGPGSGWRIYTVAATMPTFDRATWRLRVGGLVEHPLELSYDELRALPQASQVTDFHCVTGWTVDNVHWRGVRFKDLLAQLATSTSQPPTSGPITNEIPLHAALPQ
jgi:DMSO/TMAO reductase YedYZ molybdopterin-dependent catalytic subunit